MPTCALDYVADSNVSVRVIKSEPRLREAATLAVTKLQRRRARRWRYKQIAKRHRRAEQRRNHTSPCSCVCARTHLFVCVGHRLGSSCQWRVVRLGTLVRLMGDPAPERARKNTKKRCDDCGGAAHADRKKSAVTSAVLPLRLDAFCTSLNVNEDALAHCGCVNAVETPHVHDLWRLCACKFRASNRRLDVYERTAHTLESVEHAIRWR